MQEKTMTASESYILRFSAWAPGINGAAEWDEWANDKRNISHCAKGPEISFTDPMFRRRLSQISKMTVQVVHDLLPIGDNVKIFFISFRGELSRQFQINKMLIEEKTLSPAAFSLSVFNAPAALASMAFGLKGGYSAIYPGNDSFAAGIEAAEAALFSSLAEELVLVYADEDLPSEYKSLFDECPPPAAFGLLLSRASGSSCVPLSSVKEYGNKPLDFLKRIFASGAIHVSS